MIRYYRLSSSRSVFREAELNLVESASPITVMINTSLRIRTNVHWKRMRAQALGKGILKPFHTMLQCKCAFKTVFCVATESVWLFHGEYVDWDFTYLLSHQVNRVLFMVIVF